MVHKIDLKVVAFAIITLIGLYFFFFGGIRPANEPRLPATCGGLNNIQCPSGYRCEVGGVCIKNK